LPSFKIARYVQGLNALKTFAEGFYLLTASTIPISSSVSPYSRATVDLPVCGLDAAQESGLFVRRASFGELFMQGEHSLHQGDQETLSIEAQVYDHNRFISSLVVKTLMTSCLLKCPSLLQIGQSKDIARARNGESSISISDITSIALSLKGAKSSRGIKLILLKIKSSNLNSASIGIGINIRAV
jgi:hypothetical protein